VVNRKFDALHKVRESFDDLDIKGRVVAARQFTFHVPGGLDGIAETTLKRIAHAYDCSVRFERNALGTVVGGTIKPRN
jgi:hypothetical protein